MTTEKIEGGVFWKTLPDWLMMINLPLIGGFLIFNFEIFNNTLHRVAFGAFLILCGFWWFIKNAEIKIMKAKYYESLPDRLEKPKGKFD